MESDSNIRERLFRRTVLRTPIRDYPAPARWAIIRAFRTFGD